MPSASKKVLVFFPYRGSERAGGPEGFIAQNFVGWENSIVATTPCLESRLSFGIRDRLRITGRSKPSSWVRSLRSSFVSRAMMVEACEVEKYCALWFHDAGLYQAFSEYLPNNVPVIYQPHTPQLPWEEFEDRVLSARMHDAVLRLVDKALAIILPSEHCVEIYGDILAGKKIAIIASGCRPASNLTPIPLDPEYTYFLYVGRRLPIKGYDLVIDGFRAAFERNNSIRLVICGSGPREMHPGIIDIGFSDRVHDWIASVDCVVNANRQSYFDLSALETLSVGTPIALTPTQGHKTLLEQRSRGVFELAPSAAATADFFMTYRNREIDEDARNDNRELYQREYSTEVYRCRVARVLNELLSENW
jgi:glycosyltransferase involved in cell wall biosynthesis